MPKRSPSSAPGKAQPAPSPSRRAQQLAEAKLAASGLTLQDAEALGIDILDSAACAAYASAPAGLLIRYFSTDGKPLADWPGAKRAQFYRFRRLSEKGKGFGGTDPEEGRAKYIQPGGTVPCAYFPRTLDWAPVLSSLDPVIITEGELKAACACKYSIPCIGLGGVTAYKAAKVGVQFLPQLEAINWCGRQVYVAFDSDYRTNPSVCAAMADLSELLQDRGAFVNIVSIPQIEEGSKAGIDDFIVAQGADAFRDLLHQAQPLGLTRALFDLNRRYTYVRNPGMVVELSEFFKVSPDAFAGHLEGAKTHQELVLVKGGEAVSKRTAAGRAWLQWPIRREATKITYLPGQPQDVDGQLNCWRGWGIEPAEGDVTPFLQLIDHLFTGADPWDKDWFLDWLAYPLQHPGSKLFTSVVFHGVRHGTGKSLVGYTMGRIYGKSFTEITQGDLHGGFNEWAENKQFILGDDVTGTNKRADADMLKKLITQREMRINIKFVPSYTVPDCVNYFFTSNQPDAFFLEDDDRRFFIHEVLEGPLPQQFYTDYAGHPDAPGWLDKGGAAALFHWLLKRDLSKFNPAAPALRTAAKERMVADAKSDLGTWVRALLDNPGQYLQAGGVVSKRDLWTSAELLDLYDPQRKTGTTSNGLARELRRAGLQPVCHGAPVRLRDDTQARYYAVRNVKQWSRADYGECALHIDGELPMSKARTKY